MVTTYLKMEAITNGTATTLYQALLDVLREYDIDIRRVMSFGSDGASVMVGKENGVAAKLARDNPYNVAIHCICHRLNLAVSQVAKDMPIMRVRPCYAT